MLRYWKTLALRLDTALAVLAYEVGRGAYGDPFVGALAYLRAQMRVELVSRGCAVNIRGLRGESLAAVLGIG